MAGKVGDLTCFPVNGQSGCSLQIRGGHQEGGILSYTLGQGIGVRVDHTLWAQVRVETAWPSAHCLPSTVWGEGKQLDCLCIGEWRGVVQCETLALPLRTPCPFYPFLKTPGCLKLFKSGQEPGTSWPRVLTGQGGIGMIDQIPFPGGPARG